MFAEVFFTGDKLDEEENPFIQSRSFIEQEMEGMECESIDEINQFIAGGDSHFM